jgi:peroxiredoxin family protein
MNPSFPFQPSHTTATAKKRKVAIICSHGGLDEVYPAFILANAARMSDIDAMIFFTFYGLDAITEDKVDHLHVNMAGNASSPIPTVLAGLPGMDALAGKMMRKKMRKMDIPPAREMLKILDEAGCDLYACHLAMDMMGLEKKDLVAQVKDVITAGDFYDLSEGAQIIFT